MTLGLHPALVTRWMLSGAGHGWPVSKWSFSPLHDAEHRSAKREQGAHVRAHGCASSRQPAWREKHREVSSTRSRRNRRARRTASATFVETKAARAPWGRAEARHGCRFGLPEPLTHFQMRRSAAEFEIHPTLQHRRNGFAILQRRLVGGLVDRADRSLVEDAARR